jgi:hypothetical protein
MLEALLTIVGVSGSILYSIKMLFHFYAKERRFDKEWFGKYLTAPFEGAGLAIIVLALIRGGVAVFGGTMGTETNPVNDFSTFATAALVGFGMRDVVGWLEKLVRNMFTENSHNSASPSETVSTLSESVAPPSGSVPKEDELVVLANKITSEVDESETDKVSTAG